MAGDARWHDARRLIRRRRRGGGSRWKRRPACRPPQTAQSCGWRRRASRIGDQIAHLCASTRPRDDDEIRELQDARIVVPRVDFGKRIAAGDEKQLRRSEAFGVQRFEGQRRIRWPFAAQLEVGHRHLRAQPPPAPSSQTGETPTRAARCCGAEACATASAGRDRATAPPRGRRRSRWPRWMGSNVPPRMPIRMRRSISARSVRRATTSVPR